MIDTLLHVRCRLLDVISNTNDFRRPNLGLCYHIYKAVNEHIRQTGISASIQLDVTKWVVYRTRQWPGYSGDDMFPVPGEPDNEADSDFYTGTYGINRLKLAVYLIQRIDEYCHNNGANHESPS